MGNLDYSQLAHQNKKAKTIGDIKNASDISKSRTELLDILHDEITSYINHNFPDLINSIISGKQGREVLERIIEEQIDKSEQTKGFAKTELIKKQVDEMLGWGKLQPLIDEGDVTDIFTNQDLKVIKRVGGKDIETNISFESDEEIETFIRNIMIRTGETINRDKCITSAYDRIYEVRIEAGIYGSQTRREVVNRPFLALRLYPAMDFTEKEFLMNETFNEEILEFYKEYGKDSTIVISGKPGAGKSAQLDFILSLDDPMKRLIGIEEKSELKYRGKNSIFFEERKGGKEDARHKYDMAEYAKVATRLAGHKVVIGEVRGHEAWYLQRLIDMGYNALYSVHGGDVKKAIRMTAWLMTLHSSEMSIMDYEERLCDSIDFVIQMEQKKVIDIAEVKGYDREKKEPIINKIFELALNEEGKFYWIKRPLSPEFLKKWELKNKLKEREV